MDFLCGLYFSLAVLLGCGAEVPVEPEPTASVEPSDTEKKAESTDGKSMWEWKYEQMCGCTFTREPLTPEQIAAKEADKASPTGGRFIFIPER